MSGQPPVHDFIGIGIGPFNLGLACLTRPITALNGLFLDRGAGFDWHPGLMLPGTTLQTPFLADLVSLADPTHPLSFLNYLKRQGRIYAFYIREDFFVLRREYNRYCQWAAAQCPNLRFGHEVRSVSWDAERRIYHVRGRDAAGERDFACQTRHLVLGIGTEPWRPACCRHPDPRICHSAEYLDHRAALQRLDHITVVGGGQSAAEIFHDLLQTQAVHGCRLTWLTRSPRFLPLEYTRLTLEMTSPDYIDYFHALPESTRDRLLAGQGALYKGINSQLINAIYQLMYQQQVEGLPPPELLTGTELRACHETGTDRPLRLELRHAETDRAFAMETGGLILATGYQPRQADFLAPVQSQIRRDRRGRYRVARNYSIDDEGRRIFVQNAELHSHGLASPDLGMACYRNASIIESLLGQAHYGIEQRIAFQHFGPGGEAPACPPQATD